MNADRLSREYVIVDVLVANEPPADPISMALKEGETRPSLVDFIETEQIEENARLLVAMSPTAEDGNQDLTIAVPGSYPVTYGIWILVEGIEQIVRKAGTLTVE